MENGLKEDVFRRSENGLTNIVLKTKKNFISTQKISIGPIENLNVKGAANTEKNIQKEPKLEIKNT